MRKGTIMAVILILLRWAAQDVEAITPPSTEVKIGGLVALNTSIGRMALRSMQMAVNDINNDSIILNSAHLILQTMDTNCSSFQGALAAVELLKQEVVAIVGPQSSQVSHFIAHLGGVMQVPLVSFAATDPSLSEYQYPYFFRIAQSDDTQMTAVAAMIGYYGWKEVVALFSDDDYGTNAITALDNELVAFGARIVQKAALPPGIDRSTLGSILISLQSMQSRVFVVHMPQSVGLMLFSVAYYLRMMTVGYAWIATDLLTASLSADNTRLMRGLIGTRSHVSNSLKLQSFLSDWRQLNGQLVEPNEIAYGLYAYDSVWVIAKAIDAYLKANGSFAFEGPVLPFTPSPSDQEGASDLAQLKSFKGGPLLRQQILKINFSGVSGWIELNEKGDRLASSFEIINMAEDLQNVIGYWRNETGLSTFNPDDPNQRTRLSTQENRQQLLGAVWPGDSSQVPRGWVLPKNGRPLKIAVPHKTGYEQFVNWSIDSDNVTRFRGFCIDVFDNAVKKLQYAVSYELVPYGSGNSTPIYDEMIDLLAKKEVDAVVGDVTITTKRLEIIDFTQPYIESGLVVLVAEKSNHNSYAWAFLRPFTPTMWAATGLFFIFTGLVVWMLEHKKNCDFRGQPKKQVVTILWFSFSTLFFSHRENVKSILGRCVIVIWLFVVLIINSSYTANLTSILTVQQLSPTIQGISTLQAMNVPIGYQTGSFARDYLIGINIASERLKPYSSVQEYLKALTLGPYNGGVAAIVDELPYIQFFLSSECGYTIAGQEFTKGGWGFAFPKNSELALDLSTAILSLSETGDLQRIHDFWINEGKCKGDGNKMDSNQLGLGSFWGLFLVTGLASIACLIIYTIKLLYQFLKRPSHDDDVESPDADRSVSARGARFIRSFASYADQRPTPIERPPRRSNSKKRKKDANAIEEEPALGSFPTVANVNSSFSSASVPSIRFESGNT